MKRILERIVPLLVFSSGALHCATDATDSGSQTHWLGVCDRDVDCESGLTCECSRCTKVCGDASACSGLGRDALCVPSGSPAHDALCGADSSPAVCLPECGGDCRAGEQCVDGACVPGACENGQKLNYPTPGCDGTVRPVCAGPAFDACIAYYCTCNGETATAGCGSIGEPWMSLGPCESEDAGAGGSSGTGGRGTGGGNGTGGRNGAGGDGSIGGQSGEGGAGGTNTGGTGSGGGSSEAGACPEFEMLLYTRPGCNGTVTPVCGGPPPPCVTYACGCDGRTITGCGVYGEAWAYDGPCSDAGAMP